MLHIAICDDEGAQRALTEALVARYLEDKSDVSAKACAFSSAAALLEACGEGGTDFDVYILDVMMPEQNGIDAGLALRSLGRDGAIVYLTSSPDYAVDSYLARADNYLLKPVDEARFFAAMDRALGAVRRQKAACVAIRTREETARVQLDDIVYAELVKRAVRYHLRDGGTLDSLTITGAFQEAVEGLLADARFTLCAASFAVNLHFVKSVSKTDATLTDGARVPLSRAMAGNVKKRWVEYWLGGCAL